MNFKQTLMTHALIPGLNRLAQVDYDSIHLYDQALRHITDLKVKEKIGDFKVDHEKHVSDLSRVIAALGGEPIARKKDALGYLLETFTNLRSITGTNGALNAMNTNEMLTNAAYRAALALDLPADAREVVEANYADEKRHKAFIEKELARRSWRKLLIKAA